MTQPPETFDDETARRILERAAELDRDRRDGLSLAELEEAAAEAGIDPASVREAARAERSTALVLAADAGDGSVVLGHRLDDDEVDWVVQRAQDRFGAVGSVTEVGGRTTWQSHGGGQRYVELAITRGDDETAITIAESDHALHGGALVLGSTTATLAAVAAAALTTITGAGGVAIIAGSALIPPVLVWRWVRSVKRRRAAERAALLNDVDRT